MAKTANNVHLPMKEARHCHLRLRQIQMGELALISDTSADAIIEMFKLLDKQLRSVDNA